MISGRRIRGHDISQLPFPYSGGYAAGVCIPGRYTGHVLSWVCEPGAGGKQMGIMNILGLGGGASTPSPASGKTFSDLLAAFWDWTGDRPTPSFLFRGQGEDLPIRPKIGRGDYGYSHARERAMFNAFKVGARPLLPQRPETDWEWLALAQHHGAPTRLTDWSTNPLVAAWFAVTSYPLDKDAVIFALDTARTDILTVDVQTGAVSNGTKIIDPIEPKDGVYLLETAPVSPRITTQRGIFTSHGSPETPFVVDLPDKFIIPKEMRGEMQSQLLDFGIDASHVFPDLDGFCRTLDWRFRSGKGFSALS